MKFWSSTLFSAFAHAALLCIPISVPLCDMKNVAIQPNELQFVILQNEKAQVGNALSAPDEPPRLAPKPPPEESAKLQAITPTKGASTAKKPPSVEKEKSRSVPVAGKNPHPKAKPLDRAEQVPSRIVQKQESDSTASTVSPPARESPPPGLSVKQEAGAGLPSPGPSGPEPEGKENASTSAARPPADSGPVNVPFGSADGPRFAHRMLPKYPRLARELGREGRVILKLTIDERGRLVNVEVVGKAGSGFDEEAVRAVKESTFLPATRNGKPVTCIARVPIRFELRSSEND